MFKVSSIIVAILFSLIFSVSHASEAVGFYSKGSLREGESVMDRSGGHMQKLFLARKKLYSTGVLLHVLEKVSDEMKKSYPDIEVMQIGDLSAKKGRKISRHQSHQNGLDADLVYFRKDRFVQTPYEPEWAEYFVKGGKVTDNFDIERNWRFVEVLFNNANIGRIFVDTKIKKLFCDHVREIRKGKTEEVKARYNEILRHLRPAKYHKTHLHLRLKCPLDHNSCRKQGVPSKRTGCSSFELAKDFSADI